ncbi:hypothetical protein ACFX11_030572 [Malus domestica]
MYTLTYKIQYWADQKFRERTYTEEDEVQKENLPGDAELKLKVHRTGTLGQRKEELKLKVHRSGTLR